MAGERTELAWWRTGLAALAVAVGIGRLAPELQTSGATWPYVVVGIGFALYGIALLERFVDARRPVRSVRKSTPWTGARQLSRPPARCSGSRSSL